MLLALLPLLLFSCNDKAKTLCPVSSHIGGPLADCFEVVERDYKIIGNQVNIEFVRVKEGMPEPQIVASFLDDAGNVIGTSPLDVSRCSDDLKFLFANKVGESSTIAFAIGTISPTRVRFEGTTEEEENHASTTVVPLAVQPEATTEDTQSVSEEDLVNEQVDVLMSEVDDEDDDEDMDEDDDEDEEITPSKPLSSGSNKWDKVLDDYESYVDQYVKLVKKARNGDVSAIAEYASMLEKAEKLEEELDNAKNDLTTAQSQRLLKISQKMTNAAMEGF